MQGKYAQAEPLFELSQTVREKVNGPENPHVARSLHNRAASLQSQVKPLRQRIFEIE